MKNESAERQPLINSNASNGCRPPPVYSSHQSPVDDCRSPFWIHTIRYDRRD